MKILTLCILDICYFLLFPTLFLEYRNIQSIIVENGLWGLNLPSWSYLSWLQECYKVLILIVILVHRLWKLFFPIFNHRILLFKNQIIDICDIQGESLTCTYILIVGFWGQRKHFFQYHFFRFGVNKNIYPF